MTTPKPFTGMLCISCQAPLPVKAQHSNIVKCEYCSTENVLSKEIRQRRAEDTRAFQSKLYRAICNNFDSLESIKHLVAVVSGEIPQYILVYDDLPGNTVRSKARELVQWFSRRGALQVLVDTCIALRPNMDLT